MSGGLRPPILKISFGAPFSVTENDIVHCVLILYRGYVLGVSSGLATDRGVMSGGFMSANRLGLLQTSLLIGSRVRSIY